MIISPRASASNLTDAVPPRRALSARRRRALAVVAASAAAATALSACAGLLDEVEEPEAPPTTNAAPVSYEPYVDESGTWTILLYSIADTDLEPYLLDDVEELAQVEGDDVNLVAFVDRAADYYDGPALGQDDWVGAKVFQLGGSEPVLVSDVGDVNTGDPSMLADFVSWGIESYPADKYALIMSDHGASWPGVGGDESADHDHLTLAEIQQGIADGLAASGTDKLDLLGFDACLMATYEVASAMAPVAERLLSSQELEPGHGWDYRALEVAVGGATTAELGSAIIEGFAEQSRDEGTETEITLSLVDLRAMVLLDAAVEGFAQALLEQSSVAGPVVGRSLASSLGFGRSTNPVEDSHMTDLAMLAAGIGVAFLPVSDAADALVRAVNSTVLEKVDGQATRGATGLSIYFPTEQTYFDESYAAAAGVSPSWAQFLSAYYTTGGEIVGDQLLSFVGEPELWVDENGLNISAMLAPGSAENVVDTYVRYGLVDEDGNRTYLGHEPAEVLDDGSAWGYYDLTYLLMSDGVDATVAFLDLSFDEGLMLIDVPMSYYAPDGAGGHVDEAMDVLLSLVFDVETIDLLSETYYTYDGTMYGALTAHPDGLIVPELPLVHADGTEEWIGASEVGLWANLPDISYDLIDFEEGTELFLELWVVDFGGNKIKVDGVHVR